MKLLLRITLLFSMSLAAIFIAKAQKVGLNFDPKWQFAAVPTSNAAFFEPINASSTHQKMPIPRAWCYSDLALFCKLEVKMEKAARFPVKFRLGDVEYVDRLEGKRSWR